MPRAPWRASAGPRRARRAGPVALALALLGAGVRAAVAADPTPPAVTAPPATAPAATAPPATVPPATAKPADASNRVLDIAEFRVEGATQLSAIQVEEAVTPFLGPGRPLGDLEKARAALERAYLDRGYQAVVVAVPPQKVRDGVVAIRVTEGKIGRLRVRGARWFSPEDMKRHAPSLAEGKVPNFNEIARDIVALNQLPDRRITPVLRPGATPGTVDVDLNVEDTLPLHGSLEVNNRHGASTTSERVSGSLRYDNLWQAGHSLAFSFQLAPERLADGTVFSAAYLARLPGVPWLTLSLSGTRQDSDVSTLGSIDVQGRGSTLGGRAIFSLSSSSGFFDSIAVGLDYKHYREVIALEESEIRDPVTYWPANAQYSAVWSGDRAQTQVQAGITFNLRGNLGSSVQAFDDKRLYATGAFIYYRAELTRSDVLPGDLQLAERLQGQYTSDPLMGPDQFTIGGSDSVPGYLEAAAAGDSGASGRAEVASPSLAGLIPHHLAREWRFDVFVAGGRAWVNDAQAGQSTAFLLWSAGAGTRAKLGGGVQADLELGVPLSSLGPTRRYRPRLHFRVWTEF